MYPHGKGWVCNGILFDHEPDCYELAYYENRREKQYAAVRARHARSQYLAREKELDKSIKFVNSVIRDAHKITPSYYTHEIPNVICTDMTIWKFTVKFRTRMFKRETVTDAFCSQTWIYIPKAIGLRTLMLVEHAEKNSGPECKSHAHTCHEMLVQENEKMIVDKVHKIVERIAIHRITRWRNKRRIRQKIRMDYGRVEQISEFKKIGVIEYSEDDLTVDAPEDLKDEVAPDEVAPDEVAPDEVAPDEIAPDEIAPDEVAPDGAE
jgi:hypothetical protein